jgi:ABC-type bacteriocin/lantibiotic exporter with double-glycine peptidase domain
VLGGSRRLLVITSGLALLQSLLIVPIGLLFKRIFDHTISGHHSGELLAICAVLVALSLAAAGLALFTRHLVLGATKSAVLRLQITMLERMQALPAAWADRQDTRLLHAIIVQDSARIDVMLNAVAAQLLPAVIVAAGLSVAMFVVSPVLFLLLVPFVPLMLLVTRLLERRLAVRTRSWHTAFDRFTSRVHFLLRARSLITTHGTEEQELGAARTELEDLRDTGRAMAWLGAAYVQAGSAMTTVAAILVLLVGGLAVVHGDASLGALISFYALAALVRGQLSTIVTAVPEIVSAGESLVRLNTLLEADEPQPYRGLRAPDAVLPIVVQDVDFHYEGGPAVLRGASLEIERGELVVLTGANGAGKTTLAALILGLYKPVSGSLVAAGVPFAELDIRALRRRIALVGQDPILFPGTIAQNIGYGSPTSAPADIVRAARSSTADAFISGLPQGYDTPVGEEGGLLSGGQGQRIAIARALLHAPELLILDEPTANLDQESVGALVSNLRQRSRAGAILVISHHPEVIAAADRAYLLSEGTLSLSSSSYASLRRQGA